MRDIPSHRSEYEIDWSTVELWELYPKAYKLTRRSVASYSELFSSLCGGNGKGGGSVVANAKHSLGM